MMFSDPVRGPGYRTHGHVQSSRWRCSVLVALWSNSHTSSGPLGYREEHRRVRNACCTAKNMGRLGPRSVLAGTLLFRLREGPGFHGKTSTRFVPTLCSSPCHNHTSCLRSTHLNTTPFTRGTGAAANNSRGTAAGGNQILTAIIMNAPTLLMCRAVVDPRRR
ncbi:hypothetical protein ARMGADRAFT_229105 [Armillaria gallica]|uniref:Uncharacterized protein n=1 Tax=Armillaria gallica TaxID=47427 RepID=A0A2H3EFQ4_ARMGA|nr:hypothetical protein ARMGADRAFT_229105 [Armillaria gallica]